MGINNPDSSPRPKKRSVVNIAPALPSGRDQPEEEGGRENNAKGYANERFTDRILTYTLLYSISDPSHATFFLLPGTRRVLDLGPG